MSDRQLLAEQATQLGLAGLAIGGTVVSGPLASALVPVAILAAFGVDLLEKGEQRTVKKAINDSLKALSSFQDLTDQDIAQAKELLLGDNAQLMIDPKVLATASSSQDIADRMLQPIFDFSSVSHDSAVATALQSVMSAVFDALRQTDTFRHALSDEQLRHLVGESGVLENYLKEVKQNVDETRVGVNELLKAALGNRQPPFAPMPESSTINHYAARRFGVLGREEEQQTLSRFLEGSAGFQWLQIAGVGGQGKSRLALELVRDAQASGWTAGYMQRSELEEFVDDWRTWLPNESTLIVVDYLIGLEKWIAPLLHKLSRRSKDLTVSVRVLLIERQRWDRGGLQEFKGDQHGASEMSVSMGEGRAEWFQKIAERHDGKDVALMATCFDGNVIELKQLTPDDLVSIVRQVAELDGQTPNVDDEIIAVYLARIDESGRPLYAYFLGQALGEGRLVGAWAKNDLLNDVLQREHSRRWKKMFPGSPPAIGDDVPSIRLALLATMIGPVDCQHLASQTNWSFPDSSTRREAMVMTDGPLSEEFSGASQFIPALQPDLLGEWFVLRAIEEGAQVDVLLETAWELSPDTLAAFLVRVAQDFPDHVSFNKLIERGPTVDKGQLALGKVVSLMLNPLSKAKRSFPKSLMVSLRFAASSGDVRAMRNLGICYARGDGVDQDLGTGLYWTRKSAEAGDHEAMRMLGYSYREGNGVDQDLALAVEWIRKSAEAGNDVAMRMLGDSYFYGDDCVDKDLDLGVKWIRKAAEAGNLYAADHLGVCYALGLGVDKDLDLSVEWYRKGAEAGSGDSMVNLGYCYIFGKGVNKDIDLATEWYRKAAKAGSVYAKYLLAELNNINSN